jgi:hypothetical protein
MRSSALVTWTVALLGAASLAFTPGSAGAATAATPVGNDISWPQCAKTLPTGQAFGIVGVNDGLANNTNPCFADELAWSQKSVGGTGQPFTALYVNTANPGLTGSWWPTSNTYPTNAASPVSNPYGICTGADDAACAYMYGYAKAYDDVNSRGVANPSTYLWWLDVETTNSWETNTTANAADLEGMTAYMQSIGAHVGIYSTRYQWGVIAGPVSSASNLAKLPNWIPGARTLTGARANCSAAPLMAGKVTVSQYLSHNLDYDYSCI